MVAVVTGSGSGLGRAIAESFYRNGKAVALIDRDAKSLAAASAGLGGQGDRLREYVLDVSDELAVAEVFTSIARDLGNVSILVNSAGILDMRPALEMPADAWKRVMAVNLDGSFFCARQAALQMKEKGLGRIVNIASISGLRASVGRIAYGTSKAGIIAMTQQLAVEWAQYGITVNAIAPGPIESPMSAMVSAEGQQAYLSRMPVKRYGKPADIVNAVLFFASHDTSFITGHTLVVDGGFTIFGVPAF